MKLTKYKNNPILSPIATNTWESLSVCNPGAWYEDGIFYLLYRAAGDDDDHVIHFGLATSEDGFNFTRYSNQPVFSPSSDGPDAGCVEDPRIVKFEDYYYITYAYRAFPPGKYWLNPSNEANKAPHIKYPKSINENLTQTGLAITKDFKHYKRLGRITKATVDDRDVILFPEKIKGKFAMLHRPKEWIGEEYGTQYPAIWISFSEDLMTWSNSQLLTKGEEEWERKIGGSTPPLKTDQGWLTLYHGVDDNGIYRTGALLLDLGDPTKILGRTKDYILEPEYDYEMKGLYNGVAFPTGNMIIGETLYVYYGGADQYCCVATAPIKELIEFILQNTKSITD